MVPSRPGPAGRLVVALLCTLLAASACTSAGSADPPTTTTEPAPTSTTDTAQRERNPLTTTEGECSTPATPAEGPANDAVRVSDDPRVDLVEYPLPDHEGAPWSQWGQGIVLPDGRLLSAVGDQRGADGQSYLYEYDPEAGRLTRFAEVAKAAEAAGHDAGYGKVHGAMVAMGCDVWLSTFWGKRDRARQPDFEGDVLLRLDTETRELEAAGVPVPGHGVPSLAGDPDAGLLYGEAVDPATDPDGGDFFAFDVATGQVRDRLEGDHVGFRSILVGPDGAAYFSAGDGRLRRYDPATGEAETIDATMPGAWLRAASAPAPDGTVYGVTREPDALFALEPDGDVRDLGPVRGYVASIALSPDGTRLYYVPEAHGQSYRQGTPVVAVDTATGEDEVVVELADPVADELGVVAGGTYDVVLSPDGDTLYVGLNVGPDEDETFGSVVLAAVAVR